MIKHLDTMHELTEASMNDLQILLMEEIKKSCTTW